MVGVARYDGASLYEGQQGEPLRTGAGSLSLALQQAEANFFVHLPLRSESARTVTQHVWDLGFLACLPSELD